MGGGGKKADLLQCVLQNYTCDELKNAGIPRYYVLTDKGEHIIESNMPLLDYFNSFGSTGILEPEEIIKAQEDDPQKSPTDILICLFEKKRDLTEDVGQKRAIIANLKTLYSRNNDTVSISNAEEEIKRLDCIWEAERERRARELDDVLGMTLEERRRLQMEALQEIERTKN